MSSHYPDIIDAVLSPVDILGNTARNPKVDSVPRIGPWVWRPLCPEPGFFSGVRVREEASDAHDLLLLADFLMRSEEMEQFRARMEKKRVWRLGHGRCGGKAFCL